MKIKKSLFTIEINFTLEELRYIESLSSPLKDSLLVTLIKILEKIRKGGKDASSSM